MPVIKTMISRLLDSRHVTESHSFPDGNYDPCQCAYGTPLISIGLMLPSGFFVMKVQHPRMPRKPSSSLSLVGVISILVTPDAFGVTDLT